MEALSGLILVGVLNGLWGAVDYETPVPEYSTSEDYWSADLYCTEEGFDYPGVFADEFTETIEIAQRNLCIENKVTEIAIERKEVTSQVEDINKQIQELINQRKEILGEA
jgi:hypothetical protein